MESGAARSRFGLVGREEPRREQMTFRKRLERLEKKLGDFDERSRRGAVKVALAAMRVEDVRQLHAIGVLQNEQPEAMLNEQQHAVQQRYFACWEEATSKSGSSRPPA